MTRPVLPTPGEPDEPGAEADDFAEFLRRENPTFRVATYADKDEMFLVRHGDGTDQMMVLEFKDYAAGSVSRSTPVRSVGDVDLVVGAVTRRPAHELKSPQKLTDLAVFLAGRNRAELASEWRSHLSGEIGIGLPADRQIREAAGFVLAALRYRLQDFVDFAWRPIDAVLVSRKLSNSFVFFSTLIIAAFYVHHGGLDELAESLEDVAVIWGAAFGAIHVGRRWRGVKPPEHKPRKKTE